MTCRRRRRPWRGLRPRRRGDSSGRGLLPPAQTCRCWPRPYIRGGLNIAPIAAVASPAADLRSGTMAGQCAPARLAPPFARAAGRARGAATSSPPGGRRGCARLFVGSVLAASGLRVVGAGAARGGGGVSEPSRWAPLCRLRGRARCRFSFSPRLSSVLCPGLRPLTGGMQPAWWGSRMGRRRYGRATAAHRGNPGFPPETPQELVVPLILLILCNE